MKAKSPSIEIIYQDEDFLALNKPAGIHTVEGKDRHTPSVAGWLAARFPECRSASEKKEDCGLVQRLDRETSGILLAARSKKTWVDLKLLLQAGEVDKRYLVLLEGSLREERTLSTFIGSPNRGAKKVKVYRSKPAKSARALPATSTFKPVGMCADNVTLALVRASVARRHQVRAHAAFLNLPLVGDVLYGATTNLLSLFPEQEKLPEFFLHAFSLQFTHPGSTARLSLTAPFPAYAAETAAIARLLPSHTLARS